MILRSLREEVMRALQIGSRYRLMIHFSQFFFLIFSPKSNCFTECCGFLPYTNKNQLLVHPCPLPPGPTSHHPPHPTLQPVTAPLCEFPESYSKFPLTIYFTYGIVNFQVTLSIHPRFSLLSSPHVHRSVLCFSSEAKHRTC